MKRVLVLMAAYNGHRWIEAQVESILSQRDVEVTLLVGDDASSDNTRELLTARWGDDARMTVIAWPNPSGSAGANFLRLMRHVDPSAFDAVALADQDDVWFDGKLAAGVVALHASGAAGYSAAVEAVWQNGRKSILAQHPRTRRADFLFEGAGQGCTFVLSTDFFARVQAFLAGTGEAEAGMHFHDWMLYVLCRAWQREWVFDLVPRLSYRQHDNNDIGARSGVNGIRRRLDKIRDGWYAAQVAKACGIYSAAGGCDPAVLALARQMAAGPTRSWSASVALALNLWRWGRRRLSDRAVLAIAAIAGWL